MIKFSLPFFILYILTQILLRCGFLAYEYNNILSADIAEILLTFSIGCVYDITAFTYFLIPIGIAYLAHPARSRKTYITCIASAFIAFLLFMTISEILFWEEFSSRFNFIAVDYLVYTQEVIGNIKESYPLTELLIGILSISIFCGFYAAKKLYNTFDPPSLTNKIKVYGYILALPVASFFCISSDLTDHIRNQYLKEAAKNGYYSLFSAFRNNALDYNKFYPVLDNEIALTKLRNNLSEENSTYLNSQGIERHIKAHGVEKKHNVILVIVESLSANFMQRYGNTQHITPNLDRIAQHSIAFDNINAIGTRTVYGLAAINLSIPPVPGNSIVKRPNNENLFSLASVFNSKGYESKFLYGGFGYFDNMNHFFGSNGYQVIDRSNLTDSEKTFANIWGVCDEDIFMRSVREASASYKSHKKFFQVIMTTSNHRPYTYPNGKIDIPSHTGRNGGVKYTDYAIGRLIEESQKHEWFADTVFVIVADHTASSAGKAELSPEKYHIPFIIYAPHIIKEPRAIKTLASQIDVGPTLFGILNFSYDSKFYGQDLLKSSKERAFISNYQKLGYLTKEGLTLIKPIKSHHFFTQPDLTSGAENQAHLEEAISYYQNATRWRELN